MDYNRTLLWFFLFIALSIKIINAREEENTPVQYIRIDNIPSTINTLCVPISFTRSGMQTFLKDIFSCPAYSKEFLPHNFRHFLEIMRYGKDSHQNMLYTSSTLRLFYNKMKGISYISNDGFEPVLQELPELLNCHLVKQPTSLLTEAKNSIKKILYSSFLSKFSYFQQDPENFFGDLSDEMLQALNQTGYVQHAVDHEQLRQQVIRFIEIGLNKLLWSPEDNIEVWHSVKRIATHCEKLYEASIINQDELDDLYQSLIERFIYFLDLAGSTMTLNTIEAINRDVEEKAHSLFTLQEQEEFLEPKVERLKRELEKVTTRIVACQQTGIVA